MARLGSRNWCLLAEPNRLAVSPDGKGLAVTTTGYSVEFLDAESGSRRGLAGDRRCQPNPSKSTPLAFSADGKRFAACTGDSAELAIRIWGWAGKREEQRIAFKNTNRELPAWPAEAETSTRRYVDESEDVSCLAFSPDGRMVAAAVDYHLKYGGWHDTVFLQREEHLVRVWEASSGTEKLRLRGHGKDITGVLFAPGGRSLTTAGTDGTVCSWDIPTGKLTGKWKSGRPLFCAALSPDGKVLASGSCESVLLWDSTTGKLRARLPFPVEAVESLAFSRDGKLLAGAGGRWIRLWRTDTGRRVGETEVERPITAVAFSADGTRLFSGHEDEQVVRRWAVPTLRPFELEGHASLIALLGFTPDGSKVISATLDDAFRCWDAASGKPYREEQKRLESYWLASIGRTAPLICENDPRPIRGLLPARKVDPLGPLSEAFSCSADGLRFLTLQERDKGLVIGVRERRGNVLLRQFTCAGGNLESVRAALSPDGKTVAAGMKEVVWFWDVASGKGRSYDFGKPEGERLARPTCVKFSPDRTRVAVAGSHGLLRILSVSDGRLLAERQELLRPSASPPHIAGVAFSPDGKTLAVGTFRGEMCVREVATGQVVRQLTGHCLLFCPDNRHIAIWKAPGDLSIHDLYRGALLKVCKGEEDFIGTLALSPDGRRLAAAGLDTTVLVWDTTAPPTKGKPEPLDISAVERLWEVLGGSDTARAYEAIGTLVSCPERSLPFLRKRLCVPAADPVLLRRLIADLDHGEFARREAASAELARLGERAGAEMRAALAARASPEKRRRLRDLLRRIEPEGAGPSPAQLAGTRAVQVLEAVGTAEAREILGALADKAVTAEQARDARGALGRLRARRGGS